MQIEWKSKKHQGRKSGGKQKFNSNKWMADPSVLFFEVLIWKNKNKRETEGGKTCFYRSKAKYKPDNFLLLKYPQGSQILDGGLLLGS